MCNSHGQHDFVDDLIIKLDLQMKDTFDLLKFMKTKSKQEILNRAIASFGDQVELEAGVIQVTSLQSNKEGQTQVRVNRVTKELFLKILRHRLIGAGDTKEAHKLRYLFDDTWIPVEGYLSHRFKLLHLKNLNKQSSLTVPTEQTPVVAVGDASSTFSLDKIYGKTLRGRTKGFTFYSVVVRYRKVFRCN